MRAPSPTLPPEIQINAHIPGNSKSCLAPLVVLSWLALVSCVCFICPLVLPYLALQIVVATLGFYSQGRGTAARWCIAVACATGLSAYKSQILLPLVSGLAPSIFVYAATALWECSNVMLVFGGQQLLQHGIRITTLKQLWVASMVPAQVKCPDHDKPAANRHTSAHLLCGLSLGVLLLQSLRFYPPLLPLLRSHAVLEAECLALLTSSLVLLLDLPAHASQFCLNALYLWTSDPQYRMRVVLPYGNIYFSSCSREFWSRWSRPAGQVMRHMIYYPLGGNTRPYISIPVMFASNANAHFAVSFALVHDYAHVGWLTVFGLLAAVATTEALADKRVAARYGAALPFWYRAVRWLMTAIALRVSVYQFMHHCLGLNLSHFI